MLPLELDNEVDGQGLLEYSLILSLVALVVFGAVVLLGVEVVTFLESVPRAFES